MRLRLLIPVLTAPIVAASCMSLFARERIQQSPLAFTYTILYVPSVNDAVRFYQSAFGLDVAHRHESGQYVELKTGSTLLGFAEEELARSLELAFRPTRMDATAPGFEIGFTTRDVDGAFARAVGAGARPVSEPRDMPWGQRVAYVRDLNGVLVVLATPPRSSPVR